MFFTVYVADEEEIDISCQHYKNGCCSFVKTFVNHRKMKRICSVMMEAKEMLIFLVSCF